jgi:hypothetical protein
MIWIDSFVKFSLRRPMTVWENTANQLVSLSTQKSRRLLRKKDERDNWKWTLMILQPPLVTQPIFQEALAQLRKKRGDLPVFSRLRLETFEEGLCVQVMHIGPYASEPETLERMHAYASRQGYRSRLGKGGRHHEIYLGYPHKSAPEKLKTTLRLPIERAAD